MDYSKRVRTVIVLVVLLLVCIIFLAVKGSSASSAAEGTGSILFIPFQKAYDGIHGGISRLWAGFTELSDVKQELEKTREKLQKYESVSEDLSEIKQENERLRKMLGMKEMVQYQSIAASVVSKDPDNWFRTLVINKGSSDGVKVNMPVVAFQDGQKAVIGKIAEVCGGVSRIQPVISPSFKLGVQLQESRYPGLLTGKNGSSSVCVIDYISKTAVIHFGDVVCTSGQGGVFPEGLIVGTVIKADLPESSAYQRLYVKPAVDYPLIEEVFIILKEPDEEIRTLIEDAE